MLTLHEYVILFAVVLFDLSNHPTTAISIYKSAGSAYISVLPATYGKISHEDLPPPDEEENKLISGASYYLSKANNKIYGLIQSIFGASNEEDEQLDTGVYNCHDDGTCKPVELKQQQDEMMHETLKGKIVHMGNALTKKVKKMEDSYTSARISSSISR